ncbi:MAG: hypothetical protein OXC72_11785, partial [Roseovarius sp.]|nr:hypothetical protein [Roseovarius sp.]
MLSVSIIIAAPGSLGLAENLFPQIPKDHSNAGARFSMDLAMEVLEEFFNAVVKRKKRKDADPVQVKKRRTRDDGGRWRRVVCDLPCGPQSCRNTRG